MDKPLRDTRVIVTGVLIILVSHRNNRIAVLFGTAGEAGMGL